MSVLARFRDAPDSRSVTFHRRADSVGGSIMGAAGPGAGVRAGADGSNEAAIMSGRKSVPSTGEGGAAPAPAGAALSPSTGVVDPQAPPGGGGRGRRWSSGGQQRRKPEELGPKAGGGGGFAMPLRPPPPVAAGRRPGLLADGGGSLPAPARRRQQSRGRRLSDLAALPASSGADENAI